MILLLLFLAARGQMPDKLLYLWSFVPAIVFLVMVFTLGVGPAYISSGLTMLVLNLYFTQWAAKALRAGTGASQPVQVGVGGG
jgi:hypothetical protein